jgi:hypothetical protein
MDKCYKYKKIIYKDGLFNKTIDATYIIHLRNNGRIEHIMNQLNEYHPANIVYIVFNEGFKKCKKADFIKNTMYDLVDANINIFKHAKKNNYDNVLILEDDFTFNKEIKNTYHINNINEFLDNHRNNKFMYFLGCIPFICLPYNLYTYKFIGGATHAVIFSRKIREDYLLTDQKKIFCWDTYKNKNYTNNLYMYYKPLCYQLFPETENQKNWSVNDNNIFSEYFLRIIVFTIKMVKLDKQFEPGYTYMYVLVKTIFCLLVIIPLYLLIKLIKISNN